MIKVFPDQGSLSEAAAGRIVKVGRLCLSQRGSFSLVLSGGQTPRMTYRALARTARAERQLWRRTHFFWGDERCVPPDDPQSNYRMAREAMLDALGVPDEQVHRIAAERPDLNEVCTSYGAEFPERPDLLLLGMGADGHVASLFPGSTLLGEARQRFASDRARISATPPTIAAACRTILLVAGAEKAPALVRVLAEEGRAEDTPARLVRGACWFVDRSAAEQVIALRVGLHRFRA